MVLSWYIFCIAIRMEWEISKVSPALMLETRKCCVATAWLTFPVSFCSFQLLLPPQMNQRQQLALAYFSCLVFSTVIKSLRTLYIYTYICTHYYCVYLYALYACDMTTLSRYTHLLRHRCPTHTSPHRSKRQTAWFDISDSVLLAPSQQTNLVAPVTMHIAITLVPFLFFSLGIIASVPS